MMDEPVSVAGLTGALPDFFDKELSQQAVLWKRLALDLGPWRHADPRFDADAIAQYFDGTMCGIEYMLAHVVKMRDPSGSSTLTPEDLYTVLSCKYGFLQGKDWQQVESTESFQEFCRFVFGERGQVADKQTVVGCAAFALRCLRIGALLNAKTLDPDRWRLYCYEYDATTCVGSLVPSRRNVKVFKEGKWREEPHPEVQTPCGSQPPPGRQAPLSVEEFLVKPFSDSTPLVHWAHLDNPCKESLLALGQRFRLRVHSQCLLARLNDASPQIEFGEGRDWSTIVFPAVYLDEMATLSFERYRIWLHDKSQKAAMAGLGKEAFDMNEVQHQPILNIGVVRMNLVILWSSTSQKTVVSVAGDPKYVAKWSSGGGKYKSSPWWSCCFRSSSSATVQHEGYEPLPMDPDQTPPKELLEHQLDVLDEEEGHAGRRLEELEDEWEGNHLMQSKFRFLQRQAKAKHCTRFEDSFGKVLVQLSDSSSVLRMGSHTQLVYRMLVNRSLEYLAVLALYQAAMMQIQEIMSIKGEPNKLVYMNKVAIAKLELEGLLQSVQSFVENVLPGLPIEVPHDDEDLLAFRVCRHHKLDMQNNFKEFVQNSTSLIKVCESLADEYDRKGKDQVNNILNYLTMIMFVILPLQILTGLYGMNFKYMPELEWKYGYHYFFALAGTVTSLTAAVVLYAYKKSLP